MRILLINPPADLENISGGVSTFVPVLEPLGLLYVAAVARDAGFTVAVIDAAAERLSARELEKRIDGVNPAVIGFTSFTSNGGFLYEFGKRLKREHPERVVVFGNLHASVFAEQYLRNGCCDVVVHGEGEYPFRELLKAIRAKSAWKNVPSVSYLDGAGVVTTSAPYIVDDLAALPLPARDLVDRKFYGSGSLNNFTLAKTKKNSVRKHLFTSRGCVNNCLFCTVRNNTAQRFNPVGKSVDEIETLIGEYGADYIYVMDSLFGSDRDRALAFCREIKKRGLVFSWDAQSHVNCIDEELVREMESAGCRDMSIGIESGVQRLLDTVCKGTSIEKARSAIATIKAHSKINVIGLFVLGLPGETRSDSLQTISFACSLPLDMAQFSILTPFPGSRLFDDLRKQGAIDTGIRGDGTVDTSVWARYSSYSAFTGKTPVWVTPEQDAAGLLRLQKKAFRKFYLRPRQLLVQLKRAHPKDIRGLVKAFMHTL